MKLWALLALVIWNEVGAQPPATRPLAPDRGLPTASAKRTDDAITSRRRLARTPCKWDNRKKKQVCKNVTALSGDTPQNSSGADARGSGRSSPSTPEAGDTLATSGSSGKKPAAARRPPRAEPAIDPTPGLSAAARPAEPCAGVLYRGVSSLRSLVKARGAPLLEGSSAAKAWLECVAEPAAKASPPRAGKATLVFIHPPMVRFPSV